MKLWIISAAAVLASLALSPVPVRADTPVGPDYTMGPDDQLAIMVANHPELNQTQVLVLPNGKIAFPEVGELTAAGRTPKQLAADIKAALEKTRNQVEVTVEVVAIHSRNLSILGAPVKNGGPINVKPGWRLLEVLAAAGGLTTKPELVTGQLVRNYKATKLDLIAATKDPAGPANVEVKPGDLIIFNELEATHPVIHVDGEVAKPGAIPLERDLRPLTAISLAGNPTPLAWLSHAYVSRAGKKIPLDLLSSSEGNPSDEVRNFDFQPEDMLFIPQVQTKYAVVGEIQSPAYYPLPERKQVSVFAAYMKAGAKSQGGDVAHARILRKTDSGWRVIPINMDAILKKGDMAKNEDMKPDDILFIPPSGARKLGISDILNLAVGLRVLGL